ncbi:DUF3649 domain-containing protein [Acidovorax sp. Leaf78]|uniref:DUF3649 domain-containing protein n=1 Tax=Acidovorax sp. Leaf78 TaxID=1736237 RepID=UPI0006FC6A3B|nr:DUF3649 domain-containing protein [Acidovorax sp. Leaf78]KQO19545.1 iron transporter [Acidovorax sp. Leaf78]
MATAHAGSAARYRCMVASRALAAALGGYALASLFTAVLALGLPRVSDTSRASALLTATQLSFAVYAAAVIWAFSARSALRAWMGLAVPSALLATALWALKAGA